MDELGIGGGEDVFQEVSSESWGSRLKDSCGGICIGLLLFFGSFPLLFWNEGRAVERYDTLQEGQDQTVSLFSVSTIESANDGKLVHFTADVTSNGANLTDPIFGISTNDLKFRRKVDMFQWNEQVSSTTKTSTGGKKTTTKEYSYNTGWANNVISSSTFKRPAGHENPSAMRFQDLNLEQESIFVGAFQLPPQIVSSINWFTDLRDVKVADIPDASLRNETTLQVNGDGFYIGYQTNSNSNSNSNTNNNNNPSSTFSSNSNNPQVGDTRVSFDTVQSGIISVIAQQKGDSFGTYQAEAGGTILLFRQGSFTADEMYAQAEANNATMSWILRFVGFLVMGFGIYLCFRPLEVFADVLPILGDIVGCGIMFVAFFVAGILSGITIAIAWLVHHPMIGGIVLVSIIAFTCGVAWLVKYYQKKNEPDPSSSSEFNKPDPGSDPEQPSAPTGNFGNALDDDNNNNNKVEDEEIDLNKRDDDVSVPAVFVPSQ